MSDGATARAVGLGDVEPARSRHAGRRSAVALAGDLVVTGTAAGEIIAHDRATLEERWRRGTDGDAAAIVSAAPFADGVAIGERGPDGTVRYYDRETGERRWAYDTATELGPPQRESRFFLPYVADVQAAGDRLYVAARRYERAGEPSSRDGRGRSFTSVIYAFDAAGEITWTYEADASPIGLDADDRRLAVAYNRCPGDHQHGLVVLGSVAGDVRYRWDPGTDGQRRVGDVSLVEDGVVLASHGDYRGYRLRDGGAERWRVDLGTPTTLDSETLYAYPNHVHATSAGVVFVTGNTYATDGRETAGLHPREHTAFGYSADGERRGTADVGGFAGGLGVAGDRVAVPGAQHFRTRDADVHGVRTVDVRTGAEAAVETDGVVTAVALDGDGMAAVEEPVVYHDDGTERGAYRLRCRGTVET